MRLKQLEPTKVVVGDKKFLITPFPAFTAANLTGELASVLAPLFSALAPMAVEKGDLGDIDVTEAAGALSNSVGFDGDKIEKLMKKLLLGGNVVVEWVDEDGNNEAERLNYDLANELFCGEVQEMFILCFHVIKLNFNGFFKKLAGQFGKVEEVVARKRTVL